MNGVVQDIKMIYFDYSLKNIGAKNNNFNNIEYNNYNINYNLNEDEIINSFIICTLNEIRIIQIKNGKINYYKIDNIDKNENQNQLDEYIENKNKKLIVLIFPLKGDINPLNLDDNKPYNIEESNNKIILMSNNYKNINFSLIIGYSNGDLDIIDLNTNITKNIDKLSSSIIGIVSHSNALIVGTAINGIHIYNKNTFKKQYEFQIID